MKLCLLFSEYYNIQEIIRLIRSSNKNYILLKNSNNMQPFKNLKGDKAFSPPSIKGFYHTEKGFYENAKKYKKYEAINLKSQLCKNKSLNYNTFINNHKIMNEQIKTLYSNEKIKII